MLTSLFVASFTGGTYNVFSRSIRRIGVVVAAITTMSALLFVGSASALDSVSCKVAGSPSTSCKTGSIRSDGIYHRIYYRVCAPSTHYTDWQIKDDHTKVIVGQGRVVAGGCTSNYIGGLVGGYWGWVFNTRANATIYIDNR
jgi:hypothetical protein